MNIFLAHGLDSFFFAFCVSVALFDLRYRRVPNALVATAIVVALLRPMLPDGIGHGPAPGAMLAGCAAGFLVLIPFYVARRMGAGDVKFFAVLGLWAGMEALLPIFVVGGLLAGAQALLTASASFPSFQSAGGRYGTLARFTMAHSVLGGWRFAGRGIPYAAWLAAGALVWMFRPVA